MRKPRKTCAEFTARLNAMVRDTPALRPLLDSGWSIYGVNHRRGFCHPARRQITVPTWTVQRGDAYVTYYLHHEAAHALSMHMHHDADFYRAFAAVCPPQVQHFEHGYRPRAAKSAGIPREQT